jgi:heme A synthase
VRSKWLRRAAIAVFAVFLLGALVANLLAIHAGSPWVGRNYWRQPIDTWGQLIVLLFLIGFGGYWLARHRDWWL